MSKQHSRPSRPRRLLSSPQVHPSTSRTTSPTSAGISYRQKPSGLRENVIGHDGFPSPGSTNPSGFVTRLHAAIVEPTERWLRRPRLSAISLEVMPGFAAIWASTSCWRSDASSTAWRILDSVQPRQRSLSACIWFRRKNEVRDVGQPPREPKFAASFHERRVPLVLACGMCGLVLGEEVYQPLRGDSHGRRHSEPALSIERGFALSPTAS
jgi:hypothetical protein